MLPLISTCLQQNFFDGAQTLYRLRARALQKLKNFWTDGARDGDADSIIFIFLFLRFPVWLHARAYARTAWQHHFPMCVLWRRTPLHIFLSLKPWRYSVTHAASLSRMRAGRTCVRTLNVLCVQWLWYNKLLSPLIPRRKATLTAPYY